MARLLVKAIDYTHPDPGTDRKGAFKRGDVVCVMPDDHVWGVSEDLPKFVRIDFPGEPVERYQHLSEQAVQDVNEIMSTAARKNKKIFNLLRRTKDRDTTICRRYSIDIDSKAMTDKKRL